MSKSIMRAVCGHPGCDEFARYEADNRAHYIELQKQYGGGRWLCVRHSKLDEVLSNDNPFTVQELHIFESRGNLYWGKERAFSGFTFGPGFKAFAADFPLGTVLRITAEIVLPPSPNPDTPPSPPSNPAQRVTAE